MGKLSRVCGRNPSTTRNEREGEIGGWGAERERDFSEGLGRGKSPVASSKNRTELRAKRRDEFSPLRKG